MVCVSGVCGGGWRVFFNPKHIRALEGSSVNLSCSYTYTGDLSRLDMWIDWITLQNYRSRVHETCRGQTKTCYLHVHSVKHSDSSNYFCDIKTNGTLQHFSRKRAKLSVTGKIPFVLKFTFLFLCLPQHFFLHLCILPLCGLCLTTQCTVL